LSPLFYISYQRGAILKTGRWIVNVFH